MRWCASGDIRAVFALCDNGEIRGDIVRNVLRCFAQTVIMKTRKRNNKLISWGLLCVAVECQADEGVFLFHMNRHTDCRRMSYRCVLCLMAGVLHRLRKVSAAASQRPHSESNKRLSMFEWLPATDSSCLCDYVLIGNTIEELEHS